jgi:hypothetical protein
LGIGQALTSDLSNEEVKPVGITHRKPGVVAESLFIDVAEQVEWFYAYIVPLIERFKRLQKFSQLFV